MTALLYAVFLASGAAALIFETLWFRQAGLALGNSVWASTVVLAGFMAGLALGNVLGARYGALLRNAVRAYAIAEAAIAITGVAVVALFPLLGAALAPLLRPFLDHPWVLNLLRLGITFLLLLVPSTAMGITLPVLAGAVTGWERHFGRALGRLYGWNTLGAVGGVLASETFLVGAFGVRGTALLAAALNLVAAATAAWLSMRLPAAFRLKPEATWERYGLKPEATSEAHLPKPEGTLHQHVGRVLLDPPGRRWLVAVFLSGFCLLALEIVWFRLLLLFVKGHSAALPVILAIILAGIAFGGLAAASWLRRAPGAHRYAAAIAFAAGIACIVSYTALPRLVGGAAVPIADLASIAAVGAPLMFPVAFLSGLFFTLAGAALRAALTSASETTGVLTFANTAGAACGSLVAGFALLPMLGMERSLFLVAALYGSIGALLLLRGTAARSAAAAAGGILLAALTLFPFGSMKSRLLDIAVRPWQQEDASARVVAVREGLSETIIYFQRALLGQPLSYAMLTNSFSMSATGYGARRYMKLYVYWPMAVHPNLKRALLIGYGVGNTAKAMTAGNTLESIDVVDLSNDILELGAIVYPRDADRPLNDPRVRVHIEDGRYLLQTTDRRFDLITGEPPPPGIADVESLYSREYFQLVRGRLAEGGIVTYWLPLSDLTDASARAVLRAFCDTFEDCSLWNGSGTHLMMVGSRNAAGGVSEEAFARQWRDPTIAAEMMQLGLERPEQLGALFIGDADYLRALVGDTPPLTDDYPRRIEMPPSSPSDHDRFLRTMMDTDGARARFESSALIARLWPDRLRTASLPYFEFQSTINGHMYGERYAHGPAIADVHRILTASDLRVPVLWRLGSNGDVQRVLDAATTEETAKALPQFHLGIRLLSNHQFAAAADAFRRAAEMNEPAATAGAASTADNAFALYIYALCMSGQTAEAQRQIRGPWLESLRQQGLDAESAGRSALPPYWVWMKETFGIDPRSSMNDER
jgi:spermidine synthase